MKANILLDKHIDYVYEAYQLLCLLTEENRGFDELRKAFFEKYEMGFEYAGKYIDLGEEIVAHAKELLKEDMRQIRRYYCVIGECFSPAHLALCMDFMNVGMESQQSGEEVLLHYRNLTEQQRDAFFLSSMENDFDNKKFEQMIGCEERGIVVTEAERVRNIFSYIQKLEMRQEHRELVQDIYLNRDSYVEEMAALLDKAIGILKEYESSFSIILERWEGYWGNVIDSGEFFDILGDLIGEIEQDEIQVVPCLMQLVSLIILVDGGLLPFKEKFPTCLRMGVLLTREFLMDRSIKEEYQPEEYQKILRVLGDKSKFDILMFIKDRPAYGTEIAQHFELTTATVSHHMNQLLQLQLVHVEMREKRVYYQAKKETLQNLFDVCKKMFE